MEALSRKGGGGSEEGLPHSLSCQCSSSGVFLYLLDGHCNTPLFLLILPYQEYQFLSVAVIDLMVCILIIRICLDGPTV